jgi:hypothetical protein
VKELPYREGDWIAIPLRDGSGYGVGRIARLAPGGGVLVGYFFARRLHQPELSSVRDARPEDAITIRRFGDLRLLQGAWPVLGGSDDWDRNDWPMPPFVRKSPLESHAWRVEYPGDNPNAVPHETKLPLEESSRFPDDGAMGAGSVEIFMTKAVSKATVD